MIAEENWGNPHNWKQFVGKRVKLAPKRLDVYDVLEVSDLQVRLKWVSGDPPVAGGEPFWQTPDSKLMVKEVPPPVEYKWEDNIGRRVRVKNRHTGFVFEATVLDVQLERGLVWLFRSDTASGTHSVEDYYIVELLPDDNSRPITQFRQKADEYEALTTECSYLLNQVAKQSGTIFNLQTDNTKLRMSVDDLRGEAQRERRRAQRCVDETANLNEDLLNERARIVNLNKALAEKNTAIEAAHQANNKFKMRLKKYEDAARYIINNTTDSTRIADAIRVLDLISIRDRWVKLLQEAREEN